MRILSRRKEGDSKKEKEEEEKENEEENEEEEEGKKEGMSCCVWKNRSSQSRDGLCL